jgi:acetate kinase
MKILVINCGSSSIKYRLFDIESNGRHDELAKGMVERVGSNDAHVTHQYNSQKESATKPIPDYKTGIAEISERLHAHGLINGDLAGVGHRVLHAAEAYQESVIIDEHVLEEVEKCIDLGPLHNPANLAGIKACQEIFPDLPQIAVFDTAFFQTLKPEAFMYAFPYEWYQKLRIRRYGFHGTSHRFITQQAAAYLKKPVGETNLITMHLGNGSSMAAVRNGKAVDTSMGLTPLEGLMMGTRCGDIDPAALFYYHGKTGASFDEIRAIIEKKSGLLGVSEVSGDLRDVFKASDKGNEHATLALKMLARRVKKYLGSYLLQVPKLDALVFTGGIGENAWRMREMIMSDLDHVGIKLDKDKNEHLKLPEEGAEIQADDSRIKIVVIPTNEELAIARDTLELVEKMPANV